MEQEDICTLRHNNIDKILDEHGREINEVKHRQDELEKGFIRTDTIVANLCKKMDLAITIMLACTGTLIATLLSFFIWYIQKL